MGKFVIECPSCGKYQEASNFIFAKKNIPCDCGYIINVKANRLASKTCPHCGNQVVFDRSKGEKAECPVCHQFINERAGMHNLAQISCPVCSCLLSVDKDAENYTCPLCDTVIDVQEQISKENIKASGLASVIKYEGGNDVFVWKHPVEDFNLGSQLIVHESQEALFYQDGKALDLFGAGRYTLATQNLPLIGNLYQLPVDSNDVFHSEVYFINTTTQMGIKWGTDSKVRLFDPGSGLYIEIGASGNFNLKVINSRKLLVKIVGTEKELISGNIDDGVETASVVAKFKALIMNKVKSHLAQSIKALSINILEIDEHLDGLSDQLRDIINETLDEYGLNMPEFYITRIVTPDDDPNFKRLKQQFADKTLKVREEEILKAEAEAAQGRKLVEAQTKAQMLVMNAQGEAEAKKLIAQADAEAYRLKAEAEAKEMQMKGYTYQQETARQIGLEAMQNGITGGGSAGGGGNSMLGDVMGLGVSLGALGGVVNMAKDALTPAFGQAAQTGAGLSDEIKQNVSGGTNQEGAPGAAASKNATDTWTCPACGTADNTGKFCAECGAKRPEKNQKITWTCPACGTADNTGKFCAECGKSREEAVKNEHE